MKKVIILLFLAISFVLMILISYMKFQTILYFELAGTQEFYVQDSNVQDSNHAYPDYDPIWGF